MKRLLQVMMALEAVYLRLNHWRRSTIGGTETCWVDPVQGHIILQCDAVARQRWRDYHPGMQFNTKDRSINTDY